MDYRRAVNGWRILCVANSAGESVGLVRRGATREQAKQDATNDDQQCLFHTF